MNGRGLTVPPAPPWLSAGWAEGRGFLPASKPSVGSWKGWCPSGACLLVGGRLPSVVTPACVEYISAGVRWAQVLGSVTGGFRVVDVSFG